MCSIPRKYWQQKSRLPGIVLLRAQGSRFSVVRPFHKSKGGISLNYIRISRVKNILKNYIQLKAKWYFLVQNLWAMLPFKEE